MTIHVLRYETGGTTRQHSNCTDILLPSKIKITQTTLLTESINLRTILDANSVSVSVNCKKFAEVSHFNTTRY